MFIVDKEIKEMK